MTIPINTARLLARFPLAGGRIYAAIPLAYLAAWSDVYADFLTKYSPLLCGLRGHSSEGPLRGRLFLASSTVKTEINVLLASWGAHVDFGRKPQRKGVVSPRGFYNTAI